MVKLMVIGRISTKFLVVRILVFLLKYLLGGMNV